MQRSVNGINLLRSALLAIMWLVVSALAPLPASADGSGVFEFAIDGGADDGDSATVTFSLEGKQIAVLRVGDRSSDGDIKYGVIYRMQVEDIKCGVVYHMHVEMTPYHYTYNNVLGGSVGFEDYAKGDASRIKLADDRYWRRWVRWGISDESSPSEDLDLILNDVKAPSIDDSPEILLNGQPVESVPASDQTVVLQVRATDNQAVKSVTATVNRPDWGQDQVQLARVSGASEDGIWQGSYLVHGKDPREVGHYYASFTATDVVDLTSNPATATFTVKSAGPTATLSRPEADTVVSPDRRLFSLRMDAPDGSQQVSKIEIEVHGPAVNKTFDLGFNFLTGREETVDLFGNSSQRFTEGRYTWRARATLADSGVVGAWSDTRTFTVFGGVDVSAIVPKAKAKVKVPIPTASFRRLKKQNWSFVIVDAWGGHSAFPAEANLRNAYAAGFRRFAAYCLLNFDDSKATKSADRKKVPTKQTGDWQVAQALAACGVGRPGPHPALLSFMVIDVEDRWAGNMSTADRVTRIWEAVNAVPTGMGVVIYSRNGDWTSLTGSSTAFSSYPLWVPRYIPSDPQADDLDLDGAKDWEPFGDWPERSGKQYRENVSLFGATFDLNVFDPSVFRVNL